VNPMIANLGQLLYNENVMDTGELRGVEKVKT
jgi:hypothetical protein